MDEYAIIFIGKSGAGKGTQIKALVDYLAAKGETSVSYLEAGQNLRDFIAAGSYTAQLAEANNQSGKLQPAFLAIWAWVNKMVQAFTGQKFLFVDGAPRKLNEAYILDEMLDFYGRKNRYVLHIDVSDAWAKERLAGRARGDDLNEASVETRLGWFAENSGAILDFFRQTGKYTVMTVRGEQDIEQVEADIRNQLKL